MELNQSNDYQIDPASDYFTTDAAANHSKRAAIIMLLVGGLTFGSFLWLRIRLVSDLPRQAYAEPDSAQASQQPAAQPTHQAPLTDGSTKAVNIDNHDAKPYSVNDASGGLN